MKKNEAINLLYNRIKKLEYGDLLLDIYFVNLPLTLINQLLDLNDEDLSVYLRIIEILIDKNVLVNNESKMYTISSTFLINLREEKVRVLVEFLINSDIIYNKRFLLFADMLLQRWHPEKLALIEEVLLSFYSLKDKNIIEILENIKRIKNPVQFNAYKSLILNKRIRGNINFSKVKDLVLENPNNPNLEFVAEAYESNAFINAFKNNDNTSIKSSFEYVKYLMNSKDLEETNLIFDIITEESIFKSHRITIKLLNTITNPKYKLYLPCIAKLIENKDLMDNKVFDSILTSLFMAKTALQIEAVMSILEFPNLLKFDILQVTLVLDKYLKITRKYQLVSFNKILGKITKDENFDLYSEKCFSIINNIIPNEEVKNDDLIKDYQAYCLAESFECLIKLEKFNTVLNAILEESKLNCIYIVLLFKIPNIVKLEDFLEIFNKLRGSNDEYKKKNVIALLNIEKVIKSSHYINLIDIINRANKHQARKILEIIENVNNIENYELIKLLEVLLVEKDNKKVDLICELIKVYEYLGFEKTLLDIKAITDSNELKDIKDTVKGIKDEIKKIELKNKEGLNLFEKIKLKKLTRKIEEE